MEEKMSKAYSRVYVEITNLCNMNCSFCHGHSRPPRRMTEEEFTRVLTQLDPKPRYLYYHLMGEPLTHPDLPRFLRMAGERGFRSVLTTNGTLLQQRKRELLSSPLHKVSVSLHSFEKGNEEAFDRYLDGVMDFADAASRQGIITVLRLWNRGGDEGRNQEILRRLQDRFAGEWAENTKGIRIRPKLHLEWGDRFVWPDRDAPDSGDEVFCYGMQDHFGVLSDGTVVPCCLDSDGVIALGNVYREELSSILASPRATAIAKGFRTHRATEELCRRCGYAKRFL